MLDESSVSGRMLKDSMLASVYVFFPIFSVYFLPSCLFIVKLNVVLFNFDQTLAAQSCNLRVDKKRMMTLTDEIHYQSN